MLPPAVLSPTVLPRPEQTSPDLAGGIRDRWHQLRCRMGGHAWGMTLLGHGTRSIGWECRRCGFLQARPARARWLAGL